MKLAFCLWNLIRRRFTAQTLQAIMNNMPSFTSSLTVSIEWGYCDPAGLLASRRYFEIFDRSSWLLFEAALGVKPHELGKKYGILGIPLVDVHATFLRPIKFGDTIEITSRVSEFRRSSFAIEHKLTLDGQPASEGIETRVWAKLDAVTQKMGAIPIPPEIMVRFGTA